MIDAGWVIPTEIVRFSEWDLLAEPDGPQILQAIRSGIPGIEWQRAADFHTWDGADWAIRFGKTVPCVTTVTA